jgi:NADPH2:quinone reductase
VLAGCYPTAGPEAGRLEVRDLPDPVPGPGEVRVRVVVSGVNPTDWKGRRPGAAASAEAPLVIPDQDGAGTIDAVGRGVDRGRIGERVWLYNAQWQRAHGTAAQYIALPAELAVPLPEGVDFDLGASLGIPAMTAHRCLYSGGLLPRGTFVLVQGGAGAVGHAAIELAVARGLRVCATVSSDEKGRLAARAEAEMVLNYRADDVAARVREWAPDGVARVVEVDLAGNLATDAQVLAPGGVISAYSGAAGTAELPRELMVRGARVEFVLVYTMPEGAKRAAVAEITRALQCGALTPLPLHRFPLNEIAAAHDAVQSGAVGKVLVDVP